MPFSFSVVNSGRLGSWAVGVEEEELPLPLRGLSSALVGVQGLDADMGLGKGGFREREGLVATGVDGALVGLLLLLLTKSLPFRLRYSSNDT